MFPRKHFVLAAIGPNGRLHSAIVRPDDAFGFNSRSRLHGLLATVRIERLQRGDQPLGVRAVELYPRVDIERRIRSAAQHGGDATEDNVFDFDQTGTDVLAGYASLMHILTYEDDIDHRR